MQELKQGLDICMKGPEVKAALAGFRKQVRRWKLAMPKVKPLVSDFGLGRFRRTGLIEYWIANEQAGYCGKYLFVFDGQTCPRHRHREKHETFFVVKGRVRLVCGRRVHRLQEGDVLPVPPGRFHSFTGLGPALLLEVSTLCRVADNYFADRRIPFGGNARQPGNRRGRADLDTGGASR
ncbi:MAG: cupin domain-containing protein [Lentisphaerae bacterium]|nr:cupin domain-containing protein [Lentisphaerota bacterium]